MNLFLSYLLAYCVKGVFLWDPTRFDADERAADTAKLINLVNNADSFKVLYISRSYDEDKKEDADDANLLDSMKLLHKTFDTYRKSNDFIDGANIQYISNPEVLEDYKKLPKERSEIRDIINGEITTESSSIEESTVNNSKKSSQRLKRFRKHFRRRKETNLDTSNFVDNDDAEKIIAGVPEPQDSKETKRFILRSMHNSNQGNPIIEPVLNTYTVRVSLQKGRKPKTNNNLNVLSKILVPKESPKKKSRSKNELKSINNSKQNWSSEDKTDVMVNVEKRFKIASEIKEKNTLKLSANKQESRINKNIPNELRREKKNRLSDNRNSKVRTRQKTHNVDNTETKDENKRNIVPNKDERKPEFRDAKFEREINQRKKDSIWSKPYNSKNVNTFENYDNDERPKINKKLKSNDWSKQNNMDKKYEDRDTTSSNRNKKNDSWNKRDDRMDRKDDIWDKKDDSRSKERTWNKKDYDNKNKRKDDDDLKSDGKFKKYSDLDNTGTDKTENAGWGNYALFKNLRDKKNSMEGGNVQKEKIIPKVHIRAPKPSSYESYAPQRYDYYQKPKKNLRTFNRTPIPMAGKRPVFD
ncbi:unnamed protein product [Arctia plantaginis]|uniref:Uncharacterized protein n=1 Tax=Arctia plantaginis TaxID=874455 RepID=A0A8S1BEB3_ARCPL|nr:unnamed protein product [Arctia plantaginis]